MVTRTLSGKRKSPSGTGDFADSYVASAATSTGVLLNTFKRSKHFESTPNYPGEVATSSELGVMTDHLFLPSRETADKLLRYEAMINKHLNHAIPELERVQAQRRSTEASEPEGEQRAGVLAD